MYLRCSRVVFLDICILHLFSIGIYLSSACNLRSRAANLFRALEEKRARLGIVECVNHELLQPYPVLHEKPGM